jgi:hypothetical protein
MQRTVPAVSFTTSHRALAMKSSRMLFGKDMTSTERFRAAWNEMPWSQIMMSIPERHAWVWKQTYELGLRDTNRNSKSKIIGLYIGQVCVFVSMYLVTQPVWRYVIDREWPLHMQLGHERENARRWGADVYFADGKFQKPVFHINPPALTMTADEV